MIMFKLMINFSDTLTCNNNDSWMRLLDNEKIVLYVLCIGLSIRKKNELRKFVMEYFMLSNVYYSLFVVCIQSLIDNNFHASSITVKILVEEREKKIDRYWLTHSWRKRNIISKVSFRLKLKHLYTVYELCI